jgi:hypothetical protein
MPACNCAHDNAIPATPVFDKEKGLACSLFTMFTIRMPEACAT